MTELQTELLKMLKFFHEFCEKNDIKYYAVGGTLLGAVRHGGYIPWDDDIDLAMPRGEYEKFIELFKADKSQQRYVLETPFENKDFVYGFCKLYDTSTTLVENTRYKTKRGIFLDIFPLDGIGNTLEESKINFKKIDRKNMLIHTKICALNRHRKFYKNAAIIVARCIPSFIFNWRKALRKYINLCKSRNYDDSEYVANLFGAWHEREIVKKEWLGEPVLYKFENAEIYCPCNADAYLKAVYGDYMQLPPEEKRVTHHDFLEISLNKPYLQ